MRLDLDDNTSAWLLGGAPYVPGEPLRGDIDADLAIVGGGFTGVSAAYHAAEKRPDARIVLLEARALANGASGRNGGLMLPGVYGLAGDEATVVPTWRATLEGIDHIESIIRRHALDVRYARTGALEIFFDARRAAEAQAHTEKLASWGLPVRWLAGPDLHAHVHAEGAVGAMLDVTAGRLNGADYVRAQRPVLIERGVHVYEQTPVLSWREDGAWRLRTPEGEVRAKALLIATNAYTPRLGFFTRTVVPLHSHVIATDPVPDDLWERAGWGDHVGFSDDMDRIAYASRTADGRVVFGGGSNAAYDYLYGARTAWPAGRSPARAIGAMTRLLHRYLPGLREVPVERHWTGPVAITLDRAPVIGSKGNLYYGLGYCGHGVTLGNLAGRILADLWAGDDAPWRGLPFVGRPHPWIPPDPLCWVGYQAFTAVTGKSPRKIG